MPKIVPEQSGICSSLRPVFVNQISHIAAAIGAELVWYSDQWIAKLQRNTDFCYIIGYTFSLNDAASAQLARDKVAAYTLLAANGIAAVPHWLLRFREEVSLDNTVQMALDVVPLPVVAKPHVEGGGIDVHYAASVDNLRQVIGRLSKRYRAIALSPFVGIEEEFRVVILDKQPLITFRKVRAQGQVSGIPLEWRHNLRYGATPELLSDGAVSKRLTSLSLQAMEVLRLRFASVDIVLADGKLSVLEVNSAVSLEHFSQHSNRCAQLATEAYTLAIECSLGLVETVWRSKE